jgi:hypothetical protein
MLWAFSIFQPLATPFFSGKVDLKDSNTSNHFCFKRSNWMAVIPNFLDCICHSNTDGGKRMLIGISFQNVLTSSDDFCSTSVQCRQKSALLKRKHQISYTISYPILYTTSVIMILIVTDIVYDIGIRYCIPIAMEDYVMVLSYVYIVPLIYLNSLLKGHPRWNRSLQRNGKALQSQVEVFLIDVHPIWNTTQELMNWSRISSR